MSTISEIFGLHHKKTCFHCLQPGARVIKLFSCSTQMSMKFKVLINVKMPTNVGILTFMSMINTISELKERKKKYFSAF